MADTLNSHFQQLVKAKKNPEQVNHRIPFPVKLEDPDCQKYLLELRNTQIGYALKMEEWSDAYRTSETIFTLINKQEKRVVKNYLQSFFTHLAQIFWKSDNHLFHAYALMNLHQIMSKST